MIVKHRNFDQNQCLSLLEATLESTADGILVIDTSGRIVQYNERFLELWQIPSSIMETGDDEVALRYVVNQLENPVEFMKKVQELYSSPSSDSFDVLQFKDGRIFDRLSRPQRIASKVVGRVWSFRDVTSATRSERELKHAKQDLERIISSVSDCLWSGFINPDGTMAYSYYSPAVEKITGRPPEFYMLGNWLSAVWPGDTDRVKSCAFRLKNKLSNYEAAEYRIVKPDGSVRNVLDRVNATTLADGRIQLDGVISDITDRTFREEHQQQELKEENRKRLEAESAVHARDLFISIASHELKNPLTSLKLRLQLLSRSTQTPGNSKNPSELMANCHQEAERCGQDVERFSVLVGTLLDLSLIGAGKLVIHKTPTNLTALLNEVLSQHASALESAKCPLRADIQTDVQGMWDSTRIFQVITNLLCNAIKFSKGKPIEVVLLKRFSEVVLEVKDHGIGISDENIANIFKPFARAVSDDSYAGMGLGLYVSEQIIRAHGGSIEVESKLGEGSAFRVTLPL